MAVDYVNRAGADRVKRSVALYHDRRVFIYADAQHARVLRDGSEQAPDPPAFGAVLIDDHVLRQPEAWRHMNVAEFADSLAGAADQHHLAQRRGAGRGSADNPASPVNLLYEFAERRASQSRGDLELIAAGKEDRLRIGQKFQPGIF